MEALFMQSDVAHPKGPEADKEPQTSLDTEDVNTHGFPALAHEIYLEILSHIPSPTPTLFGIFSSSEIRPSRHETLKSLSQTSQSLRRFFLRYLWQRIEVMKIGVGNDTLKATQNLCISQAPKNYATELIRQLDIVTVRNPQLAQYVNYVDVCIGEYSTGAVLAKLARCLGLFRNLHTVQIDVTLSSRRSLDNVFERVFKGYSYPWIRNVFVVPLTLPFISSCPEARCVGFTQGRPLPMSCLPTIIDSCPRLQVLGNFPQLFKRPDVCKLIVDGLPHLHTITISPCSSVAQISSHQIDTFKRLNHLQTIIILWRPGLIRALPTVKRVAHLERIQEEWIEQAKLILIAIQRRDNLEKVVAVVGHGIARKILIPTC